MAGNIHFTISTISCERDLSFLGQKVYYRNVFFVKKCMFEESFWKNKRVTVFGLGVNMGGVGTVQFLIEKGVKEVIVTDMKSRDELQTSLEKLKPYKNITYVLGQHRPEDFTHVDMVVKNPVIPWTNEYIVLAKKHHIPVEMDASIFFALCKTPIIGVTGSKGKTTTSTLIAHILEQAGKKVVRVGIEQTGVLSLLTDTLLADIVVFELSSWRLSALQNIQKSPHIAVLTNIFPDHQNYYKTMSAYKEDKENIFLFQKKNDITIASFDDRDVREMVQDAPGILVWFSTKQNIEGDGAWSDGDALWIRKQGKSEILLSFNEVLLLGEHNRSNILAGVTTALAYGLAPQVIKQGVLSFKGVKHRLQCLGEKKGVLYYNDTTATIPEAAILALHSFSQPVILIAGGSDKNMHFEHFAEEILVHTKGLILLQGNATEKIVTALRERLPDKEKKRPIIVVGTMAKAVEIASRCATSGDIILLSPGATSFGLFANEFDRGEQFIQAVEAL
ncbi:MAG: UDP-N-acetylmuramoyl-L-alanine--D-glutamate ligase [Candidatus Moranbacteria bacterium CG17_big_fil_post_rev_8_21_14_2_50_41_107]|nr:MAG: UDP-N-acetylmuramoyl-L-alanine--D-glutamate ligase [Candidatus Moranbacteria bacterium CG17_big_fil_post_rev_8_21_14_2_50_41_107]